MCRTYYTCGFLSCLVSGYLQAYSFILEILTLYIGILVSSKITVLCLNRYLKCFNSLIAYCTVYLWLQLSLQRSQPWLTPYSITLSAAFKGDERSWCDSPIITPPALTPPTHTVCIHCLFRIVLSCYRIAHAPLVTKTAKICGSQPGVQRSVHCTCSKTGLTTAVVASGRNTWRSDREEGSCSLSGTNRALKSNQRERTRARQRGGNA